MTLYPRGHILSMGRCPMDRVRILIADDHALVRDGTRRILEAEEDLEVVAEAIDGEEAVRLATEVEPDVVLMDIAMPKLDGIAATKQIKQGCPEISVLILSAYDDDQFVFRLLQAGAAGYLLKSVHSQELVAGVRSVYHGESVLHPAIARKVLSRFVHSPTHGHDIATAGGLTEREVEFLRLMARGLSNKEIASEENLSIRTIQGCLGQIFRKLGVGSRTEAVIYALKEGLVTLDEVPQGEAVELSGE
jgi:DNA-binding NarL/FixJ family response regulator